MSSHELPEIIDNKFGYIDLAVKNAINELSRRNLSEDDIQDYKTKIIDNFKEGILKIVHYDLKLYQKVLFYIIWPSLFNFAFKINLKTQRIFKTKTG